MYRETEHGRSERAANTECRDFKRDGNRNQINPGGFVGAFGPNGLAESPVLVDSRFRFNRDAWGSFGASIEKMVWYLVRQMTIGIVAMMIVWIAFLASPFATPITIKVAVADPAVLRAGAAFHLVQAEQKVWWADFICTERDHRVSFRDSSDIITQYGKRPNGTYFSPIGARPGFANVWSVIVYKCGGFSDIIVIGPEATLLIEG